ncbi:hypothetical protein VB776_17805 [Arcicella sp. DC2W]|uniref:Uncharacterized protein n=1 Tax=Arcicella gelida TaxID=2984195 RepID=A0ABU5S8K6_9BACT|nr:hypothetical protein [Arcicella sp. DC2W]MEA5404794.1 hypothetical protein [Arcicella sp. DC2W]
MKKIDYILLSRHFHGETTDAENQQIFSWRDSSSINRRTYERLFKLCLKESKIVVSQDNLEEMGSWGTILSKILAES